MDNGLPEYCILNEQGNTITASPLLKYDWLKHGCTTRLFSTPSTSRDTEFGLLLEQLKPSVHTLICAQQKHTNNVAIVDNQHLEQVKDGRFCFPNTDGMISNQPGVSLVIMTADCAPIFLIDPVTKTIGLVHAGWKGTYSRIVQKAVSAMVTAFGSDVNHIQAWIGPMAHGCCYEVSEDMIREFRTEFKDGIITSPKSERHLDLVGVNRMQMLESGLTELNIHSSNVCTIHNSDRFYSYRADSGTSGRIFSTLAIVA